MDLFFLIIIGMIVGLVGSLLLKCRGIKILWNTVFCSLVSITSGWLATSIGHSTVTYAGSLFFATFGSASYIFITGLLK